MKIIAPALLALALATSIVAGANTEPRVSPATATHTPSITTSDTRDMSTNSISKCERLSDGSWFCCHIVNGMWWCQP